MATHRRHHHVVKEAEPSGPFAFNLGSIINILGKINVTDMAPILEKMAEREASINNKSKEKVINALRVLLDSDKGELVTVLIEAYGASKINSKK